MSRSISANTKGLSPEEIAQVAKIRAQRFGGASTVERVGLDADLKTPKELTDDLLEYASDLQIDWNSFRFQDMGNAFGEGLQDALDTVSSAIEVLRSVVDLIASIADLALTIALEGIQLLKSAFDAAILLLEGFVDLLLGTRVATLAYLPKTIKQAKSTREVLNIIADSYDDKLDFDRPISRSQSDTHLFVGLIPTGPNLQTIIRALEALGAIFGFTAPDFSQKSYSSDQYPYNLYEAVGQNTYPDWKSSSFGDIGVIRSFVYEIQQLIASLRTGSSRLDAIRRLIDIIQSRLATIQSSIQNILNIIEAFANLALLPVNTLTIYGPSDIVGVQAGLRSASSLETYPLAKEVEAEVAAAFCLHFVLGAGRFLDFVQAIFQIKESATESASVVDNSVTNVRTQQQTVAQTASTQEDIIRTIWRRPTNESNED